MSHPASLASKQIWCIPIHPRCRPSVSFLPNLEQWLDATSPTALTDHYSALMSLWLDLSINRENDYDDTTEYTINVQDCKYTKLPNPIQHSEAKPCFPAYVINASLIPPPIPTHPLHHHASLQRSPNPIGSAQKRSFI
jgi:hypothetical protein